MSKFRTAGLIVCCLLPSAAIAQEKRAERGGEDRAAVVSTRKTIVVAVRHGDPGAITKTLLTILGADGESKSYVVTMDAATRSIIVSGDSAGIESVRELIQTLDVAPTVSRGVKRFRLKASVNSVASALEQTMRQLFPERAQADRPGLIAETSSNTLLVTGTETDLQLVAQLVTELDVVAVKRSTRMQMEIYRVECPRGKIDAIEVDAIADKAETAKSLAAALGQWGNTEVLFRADQTLELSRRTELKLGSQAPTVASKMTPKGGQSTTSVQYRDVGCILALEGGWTDASAGIGEAVFDIEISTASESDISIGEDVKAGVFRRVQQEFKGAIKTGRPILLMTVDSSSAGEHVPVMVTRIMLTQMP